MKKHDKNLKLTALLIHNLLIIVKSDIYTNKNIFHIAKLFLFTSYNFN